jgi:hypothetical protein
MCVGMWVNVHRQDDILLQTSGVVWKGLPSDGHGTFYKSLKKSQNMQAIIQVRF